MRKTASATLGLAFVVFLLGLLFAGLPAADIPGFLWRTVAAGTAMPLNPHECEFDGAIAFSGNASERQLGIGHDTTTRYYLVNATPVVIGVSSPFGDQPAAERFACSRSGGPGEATGIEWQKVADDWRAPAGLPNDAWQASIPVLSILVLTFVLTAVYGPWPRLGFGLSALLLMLAAAFAGAMLVYNALPNALDGVVCGADPPHCRLRSMSWRPVPALIGALIAGVVALVLSRRYLPRGASAA